MAVIGVDLGATKVACALFSARGEIVRRRQAALDGRTGAEVGKLIRHELLHLAGPALAKRGGVTGIGVCVPGISYAKSGTVWAPNIPGWNRYPLRREIEKAIGDPRVPVTIESDRACYIMGERWRGAARGCQNAIFLAVGTGIGAGILVEGEILRGAHDSAGAIGWMALGRPFRKEYVGCGCFEYHASGEGLAKVARELSGARGRERFRSARDVFAAYKAGDRMATRVISEAIQFWGMAVANLVSLFNPEKIVFGGGVFGPACRLLRDIAAEAGKWAQPVAIRQVRLQASRLGNAAGLYGAGCFALNVARIRIHKRHPSN